MRIAVAEIDSAPGGVDTVEDLQAVRQRLAAAQRAREHALAHPAVVRRREPRARPMQAAPPARQLGAVHGSSLTTLKLYNKIGDEAKAALKAAAEAKGCELNM